MKVIAIAKRNIGNVIYGDICRQDFVKCVEDAGDYYRVVVNEYYEKRYSKENWRLEIM